MSAQNNRGQASSKGGDRRKTVRKDASGNPVGDRRRTPRESAQKALSDLARQLSDDPVGSRISPAVLAGLVRGVELAAIAAAGVVALIFFAPVYSAWYWLEALLLTTTTGLAAVALEAAQVYSVAMFGRGLRQAVRVALAWTCAIALPLGGLAALGLTAAGTWLPEWWIMGLAGLMAIRFVNFVFVRNWMQSGRLSRRTVIVGGGKPAEDLIQAISADAGSDVQLCGVFDDRDDDRSPLVVGGLPKLGTVDDLIAFARRTRIDLVIFTIPITAESRILEMLKKLSVLPTDIRLSAHTNRLQFRPRSYSYVGKVPVIDVYDNPITDWDVVLKGVFDRLIGGAMLLALSPVMLATALAIKLDSKGPVLFRQKRYGFNNELIEVFKFRSMYADKSDQAAHKLVTKGDPRVTRVGRVIRKTSLDELPQLFNVVFTGNLSLVGPRPHAVYAKAAERRYDEAVDGYFARHRVKPGITGWAQINGWRGETDTDEKIQNRVAHDLYYIENWSVLFDLVILLKTPLSLLKTDSAY